MSRISRVFEQVDVQIAKAARRRALPGTASLGRIVARSLVALALVAVTASCSPATSSNSPTATATQARVSSVATATAATATQSPRLTHVHLTGQGRTQTDGIAFDYPSDWQFVVPNFFVAGYTNGDASALFPTCCHLAPNQLAVSISTRTTAGADMGALNSPELAINHVGDWLVAREIMPTQPSNFIDVHTYWMIGRIGPDATIYSISAIFRGPGLAAMESEVDAFVASITLDPAPTPSPS